MDLEASKRAGLARSGEVGIIILSGYQTTPMRLPFPAIAVALSLAAAPPACTGGGPEPAPAEDCASTPVIFVHGLDQNAAIFAPAVAYLSAHGIGASCLHAVELSPRDGDNIRAAQEQIAPFVEDILGTTNRARAAAGLAPIDKVHLVAHSMGALSGRWYAAVLHPERVATFIATSGANHGTNWHCDRPIGPGHRQMCPAFAASAEHNALQFRLNGAPGPDVDETPYGVGRDSAGVRTVPPDGARSILYVTLHADGDPYVVPAASLLLDGAGWKNLQLDPALAAEPSPGNFQLRRPSGHDELLSSPAALRWLLQVLSQTTGNPAGHP